jgi:hypothetical protein
MSIIKGSVIQFLLSQVRTSTEALIGGKVYFYSPGTTSTAGVEIWLDDEATSAASNPYTLDADGPAQLYASGKYDVLIKDAAGVTQFDRKNVTFYNFDNPYEYDALQYTPFTFTQASITAALTAIGIVNKATLLLRPGTWVISSNADWSAYTNVTFKIVPGAVLQIATGTTTTFGGPVEAGLYQIFHCDGTGAVAFGRIPQVVPQWFGVVGDGTDESTNIQKAIDSTLAGGELYFPRVSSYYGISAELTVVGKNGITIRGDGTGTIIRWVGAAAVGDAMMRITNSSYNLIKGLKFDCLIGTKPDYGIWITSAGASVTQFNIIQNVYVNGVTEAGIKVGNSNNLDTNVDGNKILDCFIDGGMTNGVRIDGSNTNLTEINGGTIAAGTNAGIYIGTYARGVYINRVLFYDDDLGAISHVYVAKESSGLIEISNIVVELFRFPFLYAEASTAGDIAIGQIIIRNFISTCNFAHAGIKIMEWYQHGLLKLENCFIAGIADGTNTYIEVQTPDNAGPGLRTVVTENVLLYSGATLNIVQTVGAPTIWQGAYRYAVGSAITAGRYSSQANTIVYHDYGAGVADWDISEAEAEAGVFQVTNASGPVNAILGANVPGRGYFIYNGSGQVLTFKVSGGSGGTIANGKNAYYQSGTSDVVEIWETP